MRKSGNQCFVQALSVNDYTDYIRLVKRWTDCTPYQNNCYDVFPLYLRLPGRLGNLIDVSLSPLLSHAMSDRAMIFPDYILKETTQRYTINFGGSDDL